MKPYRMHEADLCLSDHWKDASINAFVAPSASKKGEATSTLMISRDTEADCETVDQYADVQLAEAAQKLSRYRFLGRRAVTLGTQSAMQIDYTWMSLDRIEIQQRQIYLRYQDYFLIFTMSARRSDFSSFEKGWQDALSSLQLRNY